MYKHQSFQDRLVNDSTQTIQFTAIREKQFYAISILFPKISGIGRSLDQAVDDLEKQLRAYEPYRNLIIYGYHY